MHGHNFKRHDSYFETCFLELLWECFAEKSTTHRMYTELAIDYEDRGTETSKRLEKSMFLYQTLASLLQKDYLYPSLYP